MYVCIEGVRVKPVLMIASLARRGRRGGKGSNEGTNDGMRGPLFFTVGVYDRVPLVVGQPVGTLDD